MPIETNPRLFSDAIVSALIAENRCPMCFGHLDTGCMCNGCGYGDFPASSVFVETVKIVDDERLTLLKAIDYAMDDRQAVIDGLSCGVLQTDVQYRENVTRFKDRLSSLRIKLSKAI